MDYTQCYGGAIKWPVGYTIPKLEKYMLWIVPAISTSTVN